MARFAQDSGYVNTAVRTLAETAMLVLQPGSRDTVQAMKSGILEIADVYVVNKDDLPGGERPREHLVPSDSSA